MLNLKLCSPIFKIENKIKIGLIKIEKDISAFGHPNT